MDEQREHFEYDEDGYVIGFKGAESKYAEVCISAHDWRLVEESLPVALEVSNRIMDDYRHMHPEDRAATFLTILEAMRHLVDMGVIK